MFARVIVDVAHSGVDRIFEYRIPKGLSLEKGQRVLVPFGAGNKSIEGYVIDLNEKCVYEEKNIKDIIKPLEDYAALTPGQIELAAWMKEFYHTPLCIALRLMFPAELRGKRVKSKKTVLISLKDIDKEKVKRSFYSKDGNLKAKNKLLLFNALQESERRLDELAKEAKAAVAAALKEGWAKTREFESYRSAYIKPGVEKTDYELTKWQKAAFEEIKNGGDGKGCFLIHGVTGSGKTEVYIRVIEHLLKEGKSAIMLVPEISLTPQMVEMFIRRLNEGVAVIHSALTAGQRYDEWRKIIQGKCRVVIGARSAVFAPLKNLGVIIMDEEQETSYKSDIHPKYLTHEIAKKRSEIENCALMLGSATPSIETYYKAMQGEYKLIEMPKRLFNLELPAIIVSDMREELRKGNRTIFSGALYGEIKKTLQNNEQAMLFINRRGYATFVMCRGCGYVEYCGSCEVTMTYHSASDSLKCHYCGRTKPVRKVCPECGKPYLKYFGIGTQKVEEEVKKYFPDARLLRMDLDTMQKKGAHFDAYESFKKKQADILIGTQMIAKGFDFAGVRLVGVIAADTSLRFPDYRSAERTFGLIEQVAGRAGRKSEGLVVVQTYSPEHYAIKSAAAHDYKGFFEQEAALRQKGFLPPFGTFIRYVFSGREQDYVEDCAQDFKKGLEKELSPYRKSVLMFESGPSPIKKIEGKIRYQILLKIKNDDAAEDIKSILYEYANAIKYKNCIFGMEINPMNMI